jgi:hypothetical protein
LVTSDVIEEKMKSVAKISLRGSLADNVAKQVSISTSEGNLEMILGKYLAESPDSLTVIEEGSMILIGKTSEIGHYPPDW